ncbi:MAG: NADH-quinone oxidoreductase subunit K [Cyclobacteriaceae bacterium]|jgi:NADH-quinone oxidoreductase subunit K
MKLEAFLYLSVFLFASGLTIILVKKNAVLVLIGIELILNSANLNLVAFSKFDPSISGQMFAIFSIVLAAGEIAIGLAILINVYKSYLTTNVGEIDHLKH